MKCPVNFFPYYLFGKMSPVFPVFYTEEPVSIGLKNKEWEHPFHNIRCPCWSAECSKLSFYFPGLKSKSLVIGLCIGKLNFKVHSCYGLVERYLHHSLPGTSFPSLTSSLDSLCQHRL